MEPAASPIASVLPSGLNATGTMPPIRSTVIWRCLPVARSQRYAPPPPPPIASVLPSGLNASLAGDSFGALKVASRLPVAGSHREARSVPFATASVLPVGLNATQNTEPRKPVWGVRVAIRRAVTMPGVLAFPVALAFAAGRRGELGGVW